VTKQSITISVIVPAYNSARDLDECLCALQADSYPGLEIIVVDDASTDETSSVAARRGVRVFRLPKNSGAAAARNYGARHARGGILFFVDADVVLQCGMVAHLMNCFEEHPGIAAVFGSYDASPRQNGVVSQYRNLLHHYVHQESKPEAFTFWAGCGAIHRSVFVAVGGFDERRFPRPSIEDIELGYRVRRAGYRIHLNKTLQATHLKGWSFSSMIRTDILHRAIPWARLIMEDTHIHNDLNLKVDQRMSGVLAVMAILAMPLAAIQPMCLAPLMVFLLGVVLLNRRLYIFFVRQRGLFFALRCIPLHFLYYLYSMCSYLYVWIALKLKINVSA
jgi:GT2 family glycosyltransferase